MSEIKVIQHVDLTNLLVNDLNLIIVKLENLEFLQTVESWRQGRQSVVTEVEFGQSGEVTQSVRQTLQLVVVKVQY